MIEVHLKSTRPKLLTTPLLKSAPYMVMMCLSQMPGQQDLYPGSGSARADSEMKFMSTRRVRKCSQEKTLRGERERGKWKKRKPSNCVISVEDPASA